MRLEDVRCFASRRSRRAAEDGKGGRHTPIVLKTVDRGRWTMRLSYRRDFVSLHVLTLFRWAFIYTFASPREERQGYFYKVHSSDSSTSPLKSATIIETMSSNGLKPEKYDIAKLVSLS